MRSFSLLKIKQSKETENGKNECSHLDSAAMLINLERILWVISVGFQYGWSSKNENEVRLNSLARTLLFCPVKDLSLSVHI